MSAQTPPSEEDFHDHMHRHIVAESGDGGSGDDDNHPKRAQEPRSFAEH